MSARAGIVLQARMASDRLPGKALEVIGGRSMLEQCLRRLMASGAAPVILATTNRSEDDVLAALARQAGADIFRGDPMDVLARYAACAARFDLDFVIRATANRPCVDVHAAGRVLDAMARTGVDLVFEDGLPEGAGVEAVTREALRAAALLARTPRERQQVTTFIRRETNVFTVLPVPAPTGARRPDVRLTVDTRDDLRRVRDLYFATGVDMPTLEQLIAASDRIGRKSVA